jgi:hypothetical protein
VKKLRLSKTLTIPETTAVSEACRRMAARRVDAVLLTDAHGLLSGIVTDKVFFLDFLAEFDGYNESPCAFVVIEVQEGRRNSDFFKKNDVTGVKELQHIFSFFGE